jgi:ribosomal protein L7Ae-like RNA K-turn-binding protein
MDERRMKGLMGLCVRAGQAVFGEDGCRRAVSGGQCGLLLLDGEISENSRKRYEELCERTGTRTVLLAPGLLEEATGKPGTAMAVKKGSFSDQMISCL